jgi:hypothetical protein
MSRKTCFVTAVFAIGLIGARAQRFEEVNTWTFAQPDGGFEIRLSASADSLSKLEFLPDPHSKGAPPIYEQLQPLKEVLAEMPNFDLDPRKLVSAYSVLTRGVNDHLMYDCTRSDEWKKRIHEVTYDRHARSELTIKLLNSSWPYNEAFGQYGIRAKVTDVGYVLLLPLSQAKQLSSPQDYANADLLVPLITSVSMRFDETPGKPETAR